MTGYNLDIVGVDWLKKKVEKITTEIIDLTPVEFIEEHRYLPNSVTPLPGLMSYDVNPYMREIVNCFDMESEIREVNVMKGVQMTYTVAVLEAVLMYFMAHLKIYPCMFMSADKELVEARIENNILIMLQQSNFGHILQSHDEGNTRKTGNTKKGLQWIGGGFLIPAGAKNADKMRSHSVLLMLKDEIDAWSETVGKDGCPDELSNARTNAYAQRRKILRGSTPTEYETSKIRKVYEEGDQRKYYVACLNKDCGHMQFIDWKHTNAEGEDVYAFTWEFDDGMLIPESVRWHCSQCNHGHTNEDKEILFATEHGAEWRPTSRSVAKTIRSYHLPSFYSPIGMLSWSDCVTQFLKSFSVKDNKVTDVAKYQVFYNNILGRGFKVIAERIVFEQVSGHRRTGIYKYGEIPNEYAMKYSRSEILFLTMTVDVQKENLAVQVMGWCVDSRTYVIDYWRILAKDTSQLDDPCWDELETIIDDSNYEADNGKKYKIRITLIDSRYNTDTVNKFCAKYANGVYPIMGRESPGKNDKWREFAPFTTQAGTQGFFLTVDIYKDRLAPVLRRGWVEASGPQRQYHFNAPEDMTDKQLKELTNEYRRKKKNDRGIVSFEWHRTSDNEMWDLLVYGHASVEIFAYLICREQFELDDIHWERFWQYMAEQLETSQ